MEALLKKIQFTGYSFLFPDVPIDIFNFAAGVAGGFYHTVDSSILTLVFPGICSLATSMENLNTRHYLSDRKQEFSEELKALKKYNTLTPNIEKDISDKIQKVDVEIEKLRNSAGVGKKTLRNGGISLLEATVGYGIGFGISMLVK